MNKVWDVVLDLMYPRRCPVCDEPVKPFGSLVCDDCKGKIQYLQAPFCAKCGKEIKDYTIPYCHDCAKTNHVYDRGMSLFAYESVADSIYRFKYRNRPEYAGFYAERMAYLIGERIRALDADALIPVPIHETKRKTRGYNQAECLADELGKRLHIPVAKDVIVRIKKTDPLKDLSPVQRQNNLKKAFKINSDSVKLKSVIIIDDIYTTGSTIDAMAKELRRVGVERIYFVTLAIGKGM